MQDSHHQHDFPLLPLPREDRGGAAREEDTPESLLTRGMETQLERFLDIFCFVQQFSCEPVSRDALPEKITLEAESFFGISLPYLADYAILIIANENNVLPEWYENPGVAGKSRLTFFAGNLSDLLAKHSEFLENRVYYPSENWTDIQTFLNSGKYTAGKLRAEPGFFARLDLTENARLLTFSMMRFDGNPGRGWLITGIQNPEILRHFLEKTAFHPAEKTHVLQRVRNLEKLSVEEMPEEAEPPEPPEAKVALKAEPEREFTQNTENTPNFSPLELYVRLSDSDSQCAKMEETLILSEKPECPSANTDEIRYIREEHLIPFNPEKFAREFHAFLAKRLQKKAKTRSNNRPKGRVSPCEFQRECRNEGLRLFFVHSHPQNTQRWREVTGDFSDLCESESETLNFEQNSPAMRAEDLWEMAETPAAVPETPRDQRPILPAETVFQGIPVTFRAVLGRKKYPLELILALKPGAILDFGPADAENLEIFVSDKCVAHAAQVVGETAVAVEIQDS